MGNSRLNNEEATRQMFISGTLKISPDEWENAQKSKDEGKQKRALISIKIKCAERAYFDYNRTLKFNDDATHSEFRKRLYKVTIEQIDDLISTDEKAAAGFDFEGWHGHACNNIINDIAKCKNVFAENVSFSYGQAQKQLNMTIKYMWLLGLWPVLNSNCITSQLHAVVDNYIIKAAWDEYKDIVLPLSKKRKKSREENFEDTCHDKYTYTSDKLTDESGKSYPWSKWDENTYKNFQKSLKKYVESPDCEYGCVFEWELDAWNRMATEDNNTAYNNLIDEFMSA